MKLDEVINLMSKQIDEFNVASEEHVKEFQSGYISSYEMAERIIDLGRETGIERVMNRRYILEEIATDLRAVKNGYDDEIEERINDIEECIVKLVKELM